jgi:hypothetical protein
VRIKQLDTIEHVTDYDSAADHVRTRQKFEELGIPMMKGMAAMRETVNSIDPEGAFEYRSDITSYEGDEGLDEAGLILETVKRSVKANARERERAWKAKQANPDATNASFVPYSLPQPDPVRHNIRRWKHEGPWLPGMGADEFVNYITQEVSTHRKEFSKYLVQYVKNEIYTKRQNESRNAEALPLDAAEAEELLAEQEKQWSNISHSDVLDGIKELRREAAVDPLTSKLVQRLIVPFLRLPTIKLKNAIYRQDSTSTDYQQYRFDDSTAPITTHPSAGLGYLRTNAILSNHPILGPQSERAPVKARVIQPRVTANFTETHARLGVAGFVTNDSERNTGASTNSWQYFQGIQRGSQNVEVIDVDTVGGAKLDILPRFASVSTDGRVHIKVARSVGAEVNVARGELDDRPPELSRPEKDPLDDLMGAGRKELGGTTLGEKSAQALEVQKMIREAEEMMRRPQEQE